MDPKSRLNEIAGMRGSAAILARLSWLEDRVFWTGALARGEISRRFGVSITQASNDISEYVRIAPDNLIVLKDRRYGPSLSFDPLFSKNARVFIETEQENDSNFPLPLERVEDPWAKLDPTVVAALMKAAASKQTLSVSTPRGRIALCPHGVLDSGGTLLVRGWDHDAGIESMWNIAELGRPSDAHTLPWVASSEGATP